MRLRQKTAVAKAMGDLFLDEGKILTRLEFMKLEPTSGLRYGHVLNFYGSWERMINHMRKSTPEVFEMIEQASKASESVAPVAHKTVAPVAPKTVVPKTVAPATVENKNVK